MTAQPPPDRRPEHAASGAEVRSAARPDRRPAFAFFDLNGTLTTGDVWSALRPWVRQHRSAVRQAWFALSHIPLILGGALGIARDETLVRTWTNDLPRLLRGLTVSELDHLVRVAWDTSFQPLLRRTIVDRMRGHRREGLVTVAVSATYQPFLQPFHDQLGIDHVIGTPLEIANGELTGRLDGRPVTGLEKVRRAQSLLDRDYRDPDLEASFAYADSEADINLLRLVGNPVAVHPTSALRRIARREGWPVVTDD